LIVDGQSEEKQQISADGKWQDLKFNYRTEKSLCVAVRINSSSHTNPVFVIVDGKPIIDQKSAIWCALRHLLTPMLNILPFEQSTLRRFVHSSYKACTAGQLPSLLQLRNILLTLLFLVTHSAPNISR